MRRRDPAELLDAARAGDRGALARLLSLVERGGDAAREVGRLAYPLGGEAYTVGLTGAPGAGKSTLTERAHRASCAARRPRSAVLAIDPSSPFTGGAILGDRVRMQDHATRPRRVHPLDGDARPPRRAGARHARGHPRCSTPSGTPWVLVETVGVGQVEVEIAGEADTTVVVVNPGWGDAVQANKAGLLEIADVFVINKADRPGVAETRRDLEQMLDLLRRWRRLAAADRARPSATTGEGVDELWEAVARPPRPPRDDRRARAAPRSDGSRDELARASSSAGSRSALAPCCDGATLRARSTPSVRRAARSTRGRRPTSCSTALD